MVITTIITLIHILDCDNEQTKYTDANIAGNVELHTKYYHG